MIVLNLNNDQKRQVLTLQGVIKIQVPFEKDQAKIFPSSNDCIYNKVDDNIFGVSEHIFYSLSRKWGVFGYLRQKFLKIILHRVISPFKGHHKRRLMVLFGEN